MKNYYKVMIETFNKPYALTETGPRSNWNPIGRWLLKTPFDLEHLINEIEKEMPKTAFLLPGILVSALRGTLKLKKLMLTRG
ncbi:hypothetical protein P7F88_04110 [Vibrio hannami]|uniref:hypothetical protein n=1 Tax=Vibrio hannami TaxID=2717094 RepID=UPI00240EF38A|nr:hypothetical protein [Vibrio hannami]MDG3085328.1 hypothetical protein [Vibrio hannami]